MSSPLLSYPIVLVHGLMGYDQLVLRGWPPLATYFHNIPSALEAVGLRVLIPRLSPTGGVAQRAEELKAFLDRQAPGEKVHLFAHSMGGLDSRYMISHLDMAERVASLTTLGTPHRGTTFADWGTQRLGPAIRPFLQLFDIPSQAFDDLTRASCLRFNEATPNDPRVRYFSIAGRFQPDLLTMEWLLPYNIIADVEGPNDGLVSVDSARWGEWCDLWEANHADLINWPNPMARLRGQGRDRAQDYIALAKRLADEGVEG